MAERSVDRYGRRILRPLASALFVGAVLVAFCPIPLIAEDDKSGSHIESTSAIYSYRDDDKPEIFFFPKDRARWDGSKVTMKEWYMLTDLQKEKFITEYLDQLGNESGLRLDVIGLDYLRALNLFSLHSNDKAVNEPSVKFIDRMLTGQGRISPGAGAGQGELK